jgi:uncharacterized protein (DUF736 family)
MDIGVLESRPGKDKTQEFLKIRIPFLNEQEFFCLENSDKGKENAPFYILFNGQYRAGALWKKTAKSSGNDYLSGFINMIGQKNNKLFFNIFKLEDTDTKEIKYKAVIPDDENRSGAVKQSEIF